MTEFINLTGKRYGRLTVIKMAKKRKNNKIIWKCQCDCKNIRYIDLYSLINNHTKSCGCLRNDKYKKDIIGQKFNNLVVIKEISCDKHKGRKFLCQCECGNIKTIRYNNLTSGRTKSCGCKISHGNNKITKILTLLEIEFKTEEKFTNCKDKNLLLFDFYLPDYNLCIEFQGKQHYEKIEYWGGKGSLKDRQRKDQIKRDFCKSENIRLLEIPYWEIKNIEAILVKELNLSPTPPE